MGEKLLTLTADIVSAHVGNNAVTAGDLPGPIRATCDALSEAALPPALEARSLVPAVSIRQSVKSGYLVCLEVGAKLKMLKRYLKDRYHLSPDEYPGK